jgi:hypothetical protein
MSLTRLHGIDPGRIAVFALGCLTGMSPERKAEPPEPR